jgi:hypothetical protein
MSGLNLSFIFATYRNINFLKEIISKMLESDFKY